MLLLRVGAGGLSDAAGNRTPIGTVPVSLSTFGDQVFSFGVSVSPQTTFAGRDVEVTITAPESY